MATQSRNIRRGLPRVAGGDPWPPAGEAPARIVTAKAAAPAPASGAGPVIAGLAAAAPSAAAAPASASPAPAAAPAPAPAPAPGPTAVSAPLVVEDSGAAGARQLRRGLPRVPGGEPWPPAGEAPVSALARSAAPAAVTTPTVTATAPPAPAPAPAETAAASPQALPTAASPSAAPATLATGTTPLRRGLPRVPGGEPWPPAGLAPAVAASPALQTTPEPITAAPAVQAAPGPVAQAAAPAAAPAPALAASVEKPAADAEPPRTAGAAAVAAAPASAAQSVAAERPGRPKAEARIYGSRTLGQWIKFVVLLALGAVAAAGILVLAARGVTTLPGVPAFLERHPGAYQLPDTAEPGFPWWAQWTHFLNFFLMVLIIRSGYQVRTEQKPPAFWTPRHGGKKISINLWLHQSLDVLWLANGLIFVVLLFASGRWMRIVPTSWEAFPNALSALLQYMTLDWPVESGWVNYNSLQQIMYFLVVFIAAPLAAITGVRMSEFWPKNAKTLNRIYPVEVARAIHFPTMLFFVLFILVHAFLVFATGALRNLNHMFGGTDQVNWVGFWLFAAAIAITAAGWFAARPLVLAPIAQRFGHVSSR